MGGKANLWWLCHHPKILVLPFKKGVKYAEKASAINLFISGEVLEGGEKEQWESLFKSEVPALEEEEKKEWVSKLDGLHVLVMCSSCS